MEGVRPLGAQRLLDVGETTLHWVELGSGRPIVLLHGLCDSHLTWRELAPELAACGRRVLLPDLPGHGLSGRPEASYAIDWYAAVVGAWLDEIGLEDFELVGHSLGGGVALKLLETHGGRIRRLGLVAAGGLGREVTWGVRLLTLPGAGRLLEAGLSVGTRIALRVTPHGRGERLHRLWHAWANGAPGTGLALARTARAAVGFRGQRDSLYRHIKRLEALPPIALFWGERDPVLPCAHAYRAAAELPNAILVRFPECGHFPHLECPRELCAALVPFLDRKNEENEALEAATPADGSRWWVRALSALIRAARRWFALPPRLLTPEKRRDLAAPSSRPGSR